MKFIDGMIKLGKLKDTVTQSAFQNLLLLQAFAFPAV